jgi:NitT/TauT family transport system ATP-binding protein
MVAAPALGIEVVGATSGCLETVSLAVPRGQRVALLGENGAGKTTLLRLVAGLATPRRGMVRADGPVGWVAQDFRASLLPWLDVAANVALPLRPARPPAAELEGRVRAALATVSLSAALGARPPARLSGGEQQRVALARALVGAPRTLLLDEPFSAIDIGGRAGLRRRLAAAATRHGITVLFATHDLDDVLALADRAVVLAGAPARVVADLAVTPGDADALRARLEAAGAEAA